MGNAAVCKSKDASAPRKVRSDKPKLTSTSYYQHNQHEKITEDAAPVEKMRMYRFIKEENIQEIQKMLPIVKPQENLRTKGESFTCLHAAIYLNKPQSVQVILDYVKQVMPAEYRFIVNIPGYFNRTPAMMAAQYDRWDAFKTLLDNGEVDLNMRDVDKLSVRDIASRASQKCIEYIE
mmetsp:Transcript_39524/g.35306  ORF Transcript_39524/g.35306 Transcript_39524/m.35306 type:complete len:178 (-) Transcript_39524:470-1003(-)